MIQYKINKQSRMLVIFSPKTSCNLLKMNNSPSYFQSGFDSNFNRLNMQHCLFGLNTLHLTVLNRATQKSPNISYPSLQNSPQQYHSITDF